MTPILCAGTVGLFGTRLLPSRNCALGFAEQLTGFFLRKSGLQERVRKRLDWPSKKFLLTIVEQSGV